MFNRNRKREREKPGDRVAIYTRVSTEEQADGGYSLSAQEELTRRFAEAKGWKVVGVYSDPGRSGRTTVRPDFQRMLADAEAGAFDIVLVHKLDRFSRSITDVLTTLKQLNEIDVSFVSATEDMDFSTPMGKVLLVMLAAFAEWYVNNLAAETAKGKKERARRGGWNGTLSFGYTTPKRVKDALISLGEDWRAGRVAEVEYQRRSAELEALLEKYANAHESRAIPDPYPARGVRLAFMRYSTGQYSDVEIAEMLTQLGHKIDGNAFRKDTVRDLLQNRFYLGETQYRGERLLGNHEALIDRELFDQCQLVRRRKRDHFRGTPSPQVREYPLAGLLVCAVCETPLYGWSLRGERRYRDPAREKGVKCNHRPASVSASALESQMEEVVLSLQLPDDWRVKALSQAENMQHDIEAEAQARQRATAHSEARIKRLERIFELGHITEAEYLSRREQIEGSLESVENSVVPDLVEREKVASVLKNLQSLWWAANASERREWLGLLFRRVHVREGMIEKVEATKLLWSLLVAFDTSSGDDGSRTVVAYRSKWHFMLACERLKKAA